jgi:hypothetical protein
MSYEGIVEFICPNGHYWVADATELHHFGEKPALVCKVCGEKAKYECDVDHTNGYDPNQPYTYNGPKTETGFTDIPCEDHYGNKYFTKLPLYQPILNQNRWRKVEGD